MFPPGPLTPVDDPFGVPFGGPTNANANTRAAWQENQRRQRTIRLYLMVLMMLMLMEGEETQNNNNKNLRTPHKEDNVKLLRSTFLQESLFNERHQFDERINSVLSSNPRYIDLLEGKNDGLQIDMKSFIENSEKETIPVMKGSSSSTTTKTTTLESLEVDPDTTFYHYPRNATGLYRGEWQRQPYKDTKSRLSKEYASKIKEKVDTNDTSDLATLQSLILHEREENTGIFLLEPGIAYKPKSTLHDEMTTLGLVQNYEIDSKVNLLKAVMETLEEEQEGEGSISKSNRIPPELSLSTMPLLIGDSGRTAFQLFSKRVSGLDEISLIDGLMKIYDSPKTNVGGTRFNLSSDIVLRVKGVLIHGIGRVSLVANTDPIRSVFYLQNDKFDSVKVKDNTKQNKSNTDNHIEEEYDEILDGKKKENRRQLETMLNELHDASSFQRKDKSTSIVSFTDYVGQLLHNVRDLAIDIFPYMLDEGYIAQNEWKEVFDNSESFDSSFISHARNLKSSTTTKKKKLKKQKDEDDDEVSVDHSASLRAYPYVPDDEIGTEIKALSIRREISFREERLELNAVNCEFEINLDTIAAESTAGDLADLLLKRQDLIKSTKYDEDILRQASAPEGKFEPTFIINSQKLKEPYITKLSGNIISPNCQFAANITASAFRIDWESVRPKAINYSFFMMITCLTQIVLLLRQLLHSQAQSTATKVSLLCIGWQTMIDAILCIGHIVLCLAMHPLVGAFSSIAFFKLLIFGVIEMKYMAIIVQARSNSNNPNRTAESVRREINKIHLRFYSCLVLSLMTFWHIGRHYPAFYVAGMYSFWVPQIILNIITEAKRPLHIHYIYGMSLTRLVAPFYIFVIPNNFLKESSTEFESNFVLVELLVVWVFIQTAVLIGQTKYGARFMIPARFLPPKFDYSRPIPRSMLPSSPSREPRQIISNNTNDADDVFLQTGTRNRINGNSVQRSNSPGMTEESNIVLDGGEESEENTLDCVICYSPIDVLNRRDYMLAPCDHIFHRNCLEQWMDVKMECPVCRKDLPPI